MLIDQFKSLSNILRLSPVLLNSSDTEGSKPGSEQVQEKIAASKNRRIPVVQFIFLLFVVVLIFIALEHFI